MRAIALIPVLVAIPSIALAIPPREPYSPPPGPKVCWECSIDLRETWGVYPWDATVHEYEAAGASAEKCADALFDQIAADFGAGTYHSDVTLDGTSVPLYVHPGWVDYYATVDMLPGIWTGNTCDDTEWSPDDPPPIPADGDGSDG